MLLVRTIYEEFDVPSNTAAQFPPSGVYDSEGHEGSALFGQFFEAYLHLILCTHSLV